MTTEMKWRNDAITQYLDASDWKASKDYRIHLLIVKDAEDSYSAIALNLPGAGSCGSTEEAAITNAKEAVQGILEEYKTSGEEIPWRNTCSTDIPNGASHKWVIVDA